MAWAIFSAENFPKWDEENGCQVDYLQSLGVQVVLKAGAWTELEDFYKHVRYESWIDAAGDGREHIITGRQVAERMAGDFGSKGIACANLDKVTEQERLAIEKAAKERNMKHRRLFVDRFEQQFRTKMQGGPGRWIPNQYELECYQMHGLKPPDTVQKVQVESTGKPQIIIQEPNPEMIADLVAKQVAIQLEKQTSPKR